MKLHAAFLTGFACALFLAGSTHSSSAPFDGRWTLQVMTDQGVCRSYHALPVRVSGGEIRHAGLGALLGTIGHVTPDGVVAFEMRQRGHVVLASGRMEERIGLGEWESTRGCLGRWQARRDFPPTEPGSL